MNVFKGQKSKQKQSKNVKNFMLKSIELNYLNLIKALVYEKN